MGGSPADLKLLRKPHEVRQQPQAVSQPRRPSSLLLAALKKSPLMTAHKPSTSAEGTTTGGAPAGSSSPRPPRSPSTSSLLLLTRNRRGAADDDEEGGRPPKPGQGHKKSVSFSSLSIREFEVIIGDHPCCTRGVPLSLGWDYEETVADIPLDAYEEGRSPYRRLRCDLRTTCEERRERLHDTATDGDIRRAQRKMHRVRSCSAKLCERANAKFFEGAGTAVGSADGGPVPPL